MDDNEAILQYQELLGEAFVTLREENPKQLDMVICSLECHLAIRYSNLGKVEKAFDCLDKISHEAAYNSKTYHYVKSAIIVNNGIKDRYDEANVNINKALELDKTYHSIE